MKKVISIIFILLLTACQVDDVKEVDVKSEIVVPNQSSESKLMSDSVILPLNLDDYVFLDNVFYVDTREPNQFLEEGHVAGFTNIPFYEILVGLKGDNRLFKMNKIFDENNKLITNLGDVGSFEPIYEESVSILKSIFPIKKMIFIISTAGVESTYLANLLIQNGYNPDLIYNVGNYSNTVGDIISYRELKGAKYRVDGLNSYRMNIEYHFGELKKINETN